MHKNTKKKSFLSVGPKLQDSMNVQIKLDKYTYTWYGNDLPLVTLRKKKKEIIVRFDEKSVDHILQRNFKALLSTAAL